MLNIIKALFSIVLKLFEIRTKELPRAKSGTHIYWRKGEVKKVSEHFSTKEFSCPCRLESCRLQKISVELLLKLEVVRQQVGRALQITSGFRCKGYQRELQKRGYKTAKKSQHLQGNAADFTCRNFEGINKEVLTDLLAEQFKAIGMGNTFCHVDLRNDKVRRWFY